MADSVRPSDVVMKLVAKVSKNVIRKFDDMVCRDEDAVVRFVAQPGGPAFIRALQNSGDYGKSVADEVLQTRGVIKAACRTQTATLEMHRAVRHVSSTYVLQNIANNPEAVDALGRFGLQLATKKLFGGHPLGPVAVQRSPDFNDYVAAYQIDEPAEKVLAAVLAINDFIPPAKAFSELKKLDLPDQFKILCHPATIPNFVWSGFGREVIGSIANQPWRERSAILRVQGVRDTLNIRYADDVKILESDIVKYAAREAAGTRTNPLTFGWDLSA